MNSFLARHEELDECRQRCKGCGLAHSDTERSHMTDRIRFFSHEGKQILVIDFSNCSAAEVEKVCRAVPELVTTLPRNSVLILSDYTGASFGKKPFRR